MGRRSRSLGAGLLLVMLLGASSLSVSGEHGAGEPESGESTMGNEAHSHPYTAGEPVLLPAGHVANANGLVVLTVRDDFWWDTLDQLPFSPEMIGAYLCQVEPGADPCDPVTGTGAEVAFAFCHGVTLWDGERWSSDLDTYVWVGVWDQLHKTPGNAWCENARPATTGRVSHWPGE